MLFDNTKFYGMQIISASNYNAKKGNVVVELNKYGNIIIRSYNCAGQIARTSKVEGLEYVIYKNEKNFAKEIKRQAKQLKISGGENILVTLDVVHRCQTI